jgi:hypothetical protein
MSPLFNLENLFCSTLLYSALHFFFLHYTTPHYTALHFSQHFYPIPHTTLPYYLTGDAGYFQYRSCVDGDNLRTLEAAGVPIVSTASTYFYFHPKHITSNSITSCHITTPYTTPHPTTLPPNPPLPPPARIRTYPYPYTIGGG